MLKVELCSNNNGDSKILEEFLNQSNIPYLFADCDSENNKNFSFPTLIVNGKKMNFKSAIKWIKEKK